jgi:hypothetical protein
MNEFRTRMNIVQWKSEAAFPCNMTKIAEYTKKAKKLPDIIEFFIGIESRD